MLCVSLALRAMTEAGGSVVAGAVERGGGEFSVRERPGCDSSHRTPPTRQSDEPRWLIVGPGRAGGAGSANAESGGWWRGSEGTGRRRPEECRDGVGSTRVQRRLVALIRWPVA